MAVPALAARLALIPAHLHAMHRAPALALRLPLRLAGGLRLGCGILLQDRVQPLQQPGFITVPERELDIPASNRQAHIGRCRRFWQGAPRVPYGLVLWRLSGQHVGDFAHEARRQAVAAEMLPDSTGFRGKMPSP